MVPTTSLVTAAYSGLLPSAGLTQQAHGSLAFPVLPEDLLLYFLIKPLMQADIKKF